MLTNINRVVIAVMFCVFACPGQAQDRSTLPKPLAEKVEAAQKACANFENGEFALEWGAVNRVDLDGDLRPDWVLNDSAFACSSAASLYCGTGAVSPTSLLAVQQFRYLIRVGMSLRLAKTEFCWWMSMAQGAAASTRRLVSRP